MVKTGNIQQYVRFERSVGMQALTDATEGKVTCGPSFRWPPSPHALAHPDGTGDPETLWQLGQANS